MREFACFFGIIGLLFGLAQHVQSQSFLTNGLAAYYPLNGNAKDASGNGVNAGSSGIFLADRFGSPRAALQCTNGIALGYFAVFSTFIQSLGNEFSLCVWFKPLRSRITRDFQLVGLGDCMGYGRDSVTNKSLVISSNNFISFYVHPGYPVALTASTPVAFDVWHSVVATLSPGGMSLYMDGIMVTNNPSITAAQLDRGYFHAGGVSSGEFDDVRIYRRALSPSEVCQLYLAEAGPFVSLNRSGTSVTPSFSRLTISSNYQLLISANLETWTNTGSPFTAISTNMVYPRYFDVGDRDKLFFRLQAAP